jgi:hypothetical protein
VASASAGVGKSPPGRGDADQFDLPPDLHAATQRAIREHRPGNVVAGAGRMVEWAMSM